MDNVLFLFFEPNGLVAFQSLPISPPLILQWLRRRHFIGALQCHGERRPSTTQRKYQMLGSENCPARAERLRMLMLLSLILP
jgi:hypothetical protein